eukprot:1436113-Alexandrium_andersonii.AAC.1
MRGTQPSGAATAVQQPPAANVQQSAAASAASFGFPARTGWTGQQSGSGLPTPPPGHLAVASPAGAPPQI